MLEKRKHPRVTLEAEVAVIVANVTLRGQADQIGAGGMSVRCSGQVSVSQPVELKFSLPEGPSVQIGAVVWWKKGEMMGFRFDFFGDGRAVIERWVNQRIQQAEYFRKPI
jgi:hypothetical protein